MGLGWFDAIAGAALPIATGLRSGVLEREAADQIIRKQPPTPKLKKGALLRSNP